MNKKQLVTQLALAGVMSLSILGLAACKKTPSDFVACSGVSSNQQPINMRKGVCKKLAGGVAVPLKCAQWVESGDQYVCQDAGSKLSIAHYSDSDYVKCYGVAAASMNDCGTATTACGGSVSVARQKDAWIAIPDGICKQIKGAIAQPNTDAKTK